MEQCQSQLLQEWQRLGSPLLNDPIAPAAALQRVTELFSEGAPGAEVDSGVLDSIQSFTACITLDKKWTLSQFHWELENGWVESCQGTLPDISPGEHYIIDVVDGEFHIGCTQVVEEGFVRCCEVLESIMKKEAEEERIPIGDKQTPLVTAPLPIAPPPTDSRLHCSGFFAEFQQ